MDNIWNMPKEMPINFDLSRVSGEPVRSERRKVPKAKDFFGNDPVDDSEGYRELDIYLGGEMVQDGLSEGEEMLQDEIGLGEGSFDGKSSSAQKKLSGFIRNNQRSKQGSILLNKIGLNEKMSGVQMLSLILSNEKDMPMGIKNRLGKVIFDPSMAWKRRAKLMRRKYFAFMTRARYASGVIKPKENKK